MRNIVKDIKENCPECYCDTEKTIEFLEAHGDISYISEHYREIWYFYTDMLQEVSRKDARETTIELFNISFAKFRCIRKWWNRTKRAKINYPISQD